MRVVLCVALVLLRFMVMIGYLMLVKVRHCFKLFTAVLETTRSLLLNLSYLFLRHFKLITSLTEEKHGIKYFCKEQLGLLNGWKEENSRL